MKKSITLLLMLASLAWGTTSQAKLRYYSTDNVSATQSATWDNNGQTFEWKSGLNSGQASVTIWKGTGMSDLKSFHIVTSKVSGDGHYTISFHSASKSYDIKCYSAGAKDFDFVNGTVNGTTNTTVQSLKNDLANITSVTISNFDNTASKLQLIEMFAVDNSTDNSTLNPIYDGEKGYFYVQPYTNYQYTDLCETPYKSHLSADDIKKFITCSGDVSYNYETGEVTLTAHPDEYGNWRVRGWLALDVYGLDFSNVRRIQLNVDNGYSDNGVLYTAKDDGTFDVSGEGKTVKLPYFTYLEITDNNGNDVNSNNFWYSQYDANMVRWQDKCTSMGELRWICKWPHNQGNNANERVYINKDAKTAKGDAQTVTFKIKDLLITYDVIKAHPKHMQSLREFPFYAYNTDGTKTWNNMSSFFKYTVAVKLKQCDKADGGQNEQIIYGDDQNNDNWYANVTGCDSLIILADKDMKFSARIGESAADDNRPFSEGVQKGNTNVYAYKLALTSDDEKLHSIYCTKSAEGQIMKAIYVKKNNDPIDYYIAGKFYKDGKQAESVTEALNDKGDDNSNTLAVRNIDATGLRNTTGIKLIPCNANCLIYVSDKNKISSSHFSIKRDGSTGKTVVQDNCNLVTRTGDEGSYTYTADKISLSDAVSTYMKALEGTPGDYHYPFFSPFTISATNTTYTMYLPNGNWGSLCLPYSVSVNGANVKAYTVSGAEENTDNGLYYAKATEVTQLKANKPYLIHATGTESFHGFTQSNTTVEATPATMTEGALTGVYQKTLAPVDSYVLQDLPRKNNKSEYLCAYYKVAEGQQPTMYQFRTYYTKPEGDTGYAKQIYLIFDDGTVTGLSNIETGNAKDEGTCYNLNGMKTHGLAKGINIIKMADGSVKKVIR